MNQNTVSTVDFSGFDFTSLVSLLSKENEKPVAPAVVALDAPRVYGAPRKATPVEAKLDLPKPVIGAKAYNPNFGVEDLVRLRSSIYRQALAIGMKERDAKLYASRFVMTIVFGEHTKSTQLKALLAKIEEGVCQALINEEKAIDWLRATRKEVEAELVAAKAPKPVAPKASVVELPPKYTTEAIKQFVGKAEIDSLDELAEKLVGCLKGDGRYEPGERNELMSLVRDMTVARAMVLGFSLRDAETTADAALEALPRAPITTPRPIANVEASPAKTDATPKQLVAKLLTREELSDLVWQPPVEVSQETPKVACEHKQDSLKRLAKLVAAAQKRTPELVAAQEAMKAERAATQAAKEAAAKLMASDLKAGAQPPRAPTPPKKEKGGDNKKGRKGKGPHAEARA